MNSSLAAGATLVAALGAAGLLAPLLTAEGWLAPPLEIHLDRTYDAPSAAHWLGTDELGRDVLSRLLHGAGPSVSVALAATAVALAIGVPAGAVAGFLGGWWDLVLTRLMEATVAMPALPVILLVSSMAGAGGSRMGPMPAFLLVAGVMGVMRWAAIARYVRGGVWRTKAEDYAAAAVALGAGRLRVARRHLLPGALTPALVSAAFGAGSAVLLESALSFLGLGASAPAPSWGRMVAFAASHPGAWWLLFPPGAAIAALVIGFNLAAEGIRLGARGASGERAEGRAAGGSASP